jgi:hypothetical protein
MYVDGRGEMMAQFIIFGVLTVIIDNGCKIIREFRGHKALYFTDPFGITIDMIERKPNP